MSHSGQRFADFGTAGRGLLLIEDIPRSHFGVLDRSFAAELLECFNFLLEQSSEPVVLIASEGEQYVKFPPTPSSLSLPPS
jgi:hypothetical protein